MKLRLSGLVAVGVMMLLGIFIGVKVSASALYMGSGDASATVAKGKVVDGTAYLAGNTVRVDGTVNGDVYCAGNTVRIEGTVNGDVRIAGADVFLGGKISGNATVAGSNVTTFPTLDLKGDLTGGASNLDITGSVGRDMTVAASIFNLNGKIGRDVRSGFEHFGYGNKAKVGGDFVYYSSDKSSIPQEMVTGKTEFHAVKKDSNNNGVATVFMGIGVAAAIAVLVVAGSAVLPRQVHSIGAVSWGMFGISLALGLAFVVVTPIVALVLLLTGLGALIAYVLLLVWLLLMAVSPVVFAYFVGNKIYGSNTSYVVLRALVGAIVLFLGLIIPLLNVLTFMIMLFAGVGLFLTHLPKLYEGNPYKVTDRSVKTKKDAKA